MWQSFLQDRSSADTRYSFVFRHPELLGIGFSLLCLTAYLTGGDNWLIAMTILIPALAIFSLKKWLTSKNREPKPDGLTGLRPEVSVHEIGQRWLLETIENKRKFACFSIEIDEFERLAANHGETAANQIQRTVAARILRGLREEDVLTRTDNGQFMFILTPVRHLDLEICVQLASRLKSAIEAAIPLDATTLRITASVGFCRNDQIEGGKFAQLQTAAQMAMTNASRSGASTIRAYSPDLRKHEEDRSQLCSDAEKALPLDQITAWFQPQISNETGEITGFEALARWNHPDRGTLPPSEFIDTLAKTGQLERLADVMMKRAMEALVEWQKHGLSIPHVGVNFAGEELRNPMLVEKIHWELDRYDLSPGRLSIEVLETVIADAADGTISRNVNGLANLGCYIDLDDFGTGHASISSIRRFAVSRLKIDRSFVIGVDKDAEQQKLVSAIITMAERLGMETLAEGVETAGEHNMLAQLGCGHVQGYGIARPMPFEDTYAWIKDHEETRQRAPLILPRRAQIH